MTLTVKQNHVTLGNDCQLNNTGCQEGITVSAKQNQVTVRNSCINKTNQMSGRNDCIGKSNSNDSKESGGNDCILVKQTQITVRNQQSKTRY
jgi:hypothetical protein